MGGDWSDAMVSKHLKELIGAISKELFDSFNHETPVMDKIKKTINQATIIRYTGIEPKLILYDEFNEELNGKHTKGPHKAKSKSKRCSTNRG